MSFDPAPRRPHGPRFLPERTRSAAELDVLRSVKARAWYPTQSEVQAYRAAESREQNARNARRRP